MDLSKTNEQAFEWLIERSLVGSTREEREAAGQTDVARQLRNLRQQIETLNGVVLSDSEWSRLMPKISNEQMTIQDKTEMIQGKSSQGDSPSVTKLYRESTGQKNKSRLTKTIQQTMSI